MDTVAIVAVIFCLILAVFSALMACIATFYAKAAQDTKKQCDEAFDTIIGIGKDRIANERARNRAEATVILKSIGDERFFNC